MGLNIRRATAEDYDDIVAVDFRNFGVVDKPSDDPLPEGLLDLDRFLVATDGDDIVATAGSYTVEVTLPGGTTLPMSGVTWVSVSASHRRRGVLRGLMNNLDELAADFGEPCLGLTASEGAIYERFGYGIASWRRVIEIDRRRVDIAPDLEPDHVRLIEASEHLEELQAIYDRYRLTQPGEISRPEPLFREAVIDNKKTNPAAIHPDGYAIWSIDTNWHNGHPAHALHLKDLIAATPQAHMALWNLVLSIDLVGPVRSYGAVAPDDPLPYLLDDPRALRTVEMNDGLWLKVSDIARCFEARHYRSDGRLVVGITDSLRIGPDATPSETVSITVDGGRATVATTDEAPDVVATRATLGPLLLGIPASTLAVGNRAIGSEQALTTADLVMATPRRPHLRTGF